MSVRNHRRQWNDLADRRGTRAFTLIEILVVLVIIAVVSAVAMLSLGIGGDDRRLQTEVRRLTTLIELANDEAAILGRDYGLELTDTGYRFVEFDPLLSMWYEILGDDILRPRKIPDDLEFELFIENRRVLLERELVELERPETDPENPDEEEEIERDENDRDLNNDYAPHILIMSSGDVSPFELRVLKPSTGTELMLVMSLTGELEIQTDAQQNR
jgi:general secretion pathway protein H